MKIHLTNFNNLKEVTYELQNNKVNFLFGVSGSGKSSIAKSISETDLSNYVRAGQPVESCTVSFEDKDYDDGYVVPVYNYDYMNNILIEKIKQDDVYSILFAEEDTLNSFRENYNNYLGSLKESRDRLLIIKEDINILVSSLKIFFNQDHITYKSTCLIRKFEETIDSKGKNTLAHKYAGDRTKWFADGVATEEYAGGKCPFCSKKLTDKRIDIINKIISIDSKSFDKINKQSAIFHNLGIEMPVWSSKNSTNKFKKQLIKIIDAKDQIDTLLEFIDAAYKPELEISSLQKLKVKNYLIELFPEIGEAINTFNNSLTDAKKALGKIKSKTMSMISKNIKNINDYLVKFSIPYVFEKSIVDCDNHRVEYLLKHKDDLISVDRSENFSFGEKDIIGLIFFILVHKMKKMIVIDDPASSFDNNRRKIILDLIFDNKQPDSTILVLSHDEVFIKLALFYANKAHKKTLNKADKSELEKKYSDEIGNTTFLESNKNSNLLDITIDDFDFFEAFIRKHLATLPKEINYQTAISIRLLYENKTHKSKIERLVYEYLSAIIHKKPYVEIKNELSNRKTNEDKIIDNIHKTIGVKYKKLSNGYLDTISKLTLCDFEYVVLLRELLSKTKDKEKKSIKAELNSIVHLSSAYITCLNPFKFNTYSYNTHEYIDEHKGDC